MTGYSIVKDHISHQVFRPSVIQREKIPSIGSRREGQNYACYDNFLGIPGSCNGFEKAPSLYNGHFGVVWGGAQKIFSVDLTARNFNSYKMPRREIGIIRCRKVRCDGEKRFPQLVADEKPFFRTKCEKFLFEKKFPVHAMVLKKPPHFTTDILEPFGGAQKNFLKNCPRLLNEEIKSADAKRKIAYKASKP